MISTDALALAEAATAQQVVGMPTDTVYGLGCLASSVSACEAIFEHKGRPAGLALPVLVESIEQALGCVIGVDGRFSALASFWPGPLTIVLERSPALSWRLGGDEQSIGLRCPDHAVIRALARSVGPLAVTSANPHGEPPAQSAEECAGFFPRLFVYDGGRCAGRPSTVVSLRGANFEILREGSISAAQIDEVLSRT